MLRDDTEASCFGHLTVQLDCDVPSQNPVRTTEVRLTLGFRALSRGAPYDFCAAGSTPRIPVEKLFCGFATAAGPGRGASFGRGSRSLDGAFTEGALLF